jgi:hypothetical protein
MQFTGETHLISVLYNDPVKWAGFLEAMKTEMGQVSGDLAIDLEWGEMEYIHMAPLGEDGVRMHFSYYGLDAANFCDHVKPWDAEFSQGAAFQYVKAIVDGYLITDPDMAECNPVVA